MDETEALIESLKEDLKNKHWEYLEAIQKLNDAKMKKYIEDDPNFIFEVYESKSSYNTNVTGRAKTWKKALSIAAKINKEYGNGDKYTLSEERPDGSVEFKYSPYAGVTMANITIVREPII